MDHWPEVVQCGRNTSGLPFKRAAHPQARQPPHTIATVPPPSLSLPPQCYMAPYTLPYIKTPLFIANSLADAWQGSNIMGLPCTPNCNNNATLQAQVDAYLHNFRLSMISALAPVVSSPIHGGFLQSCYQHVVEDIDGSWNGVVINGQTQVQTFTNWFTGNATGRIAVDGDCNVNPTCNKFTGRAKVAPQLQQLKAKATMTLRGTA